jgi:hypothetical protein
MAKAGGTARGGLHNPVCILSSHATYKCHMCGGACLRKVAQHVADIITPRHLVALSQGSRSKQNEAHFILKHICRCMAALTKRQCGSRRTYPQRCIPLGLEEPEERKGGLRKAALLRGLTNSFSSDLLPIQQLHSNDFQMAKKFIYISQIRRIIEVFLPVALQEYCGFR